MRLPSSLPRVLAPLSVAAAFAVAAPAASAASTVYFPDAMAPVTTVTITDPGAASDTVHLTVTAATPGDLADTKVFLGGDGAAPYASVGVDGVRDARYDADFQHSELSTASCSVYGSSLRYDSVPVTVNGGGDSFSADLPKGVIIDFQSVGVAVGIVGEDSACTSFGFNGLAIDYVNEHQTINGFDWAAPATPVMTAISGGRRQVALSFDQEPGTYYDIFRVVGGVRQSTPFLANVRGDGSGVQVVLDADADDHPLTPGTAYAFQVRATRIFHVVQGMDEVEPASGFSATASTTTAAAQTLQFTATPEESTTARTAAFTWAMTANDAGEAPSCLLDRDAATAAEVPCTATGATLAELSPGPHTLTVYPSDGENEFSYAWTVNEVPTTPPPPVAPPVAPVAPTTPVNPVDADGDGIDNGWLVGGKPAPAPATPKAKVTGGKVKLTVPAAPKGAKSIRVYRADGKGGYKLVKTLKPKSATFTDTKVKPGHEYKYKTVAVNAKGQQGKASGAATAKVKKH